MESSKKNIDKLFSLLDSWMLLPAYQLERRADIFFAIYLDKIIQAKFSQIVDFIVPEFPIRVGDTAETLSNSNRSYRIDYVVVCQSSRKVYFIELKTDQDSRRVKQDEYLQKAKELNISKLVDGVIKICKATASKKYKHLISVLSDIGWLSFLNGEYSNTSRDYEISVVYIQPNNQENDNNIVSFSEVISVLSDQNDDLTKRFVESLRKWTEPLPTEPTVAVRRRRSDAAHLDWLNKFNGTRRAQGKQEVPNKRIRHNPNQII